jgi:hypothetical protein
MSPLGLSRLSSLASSAAFQLLAFLFLASVPFVGGMIICDVVSGGRKTAIALKFSSL